LRTIVAFILNAIFSPNEPAAHTSKDSISGKYIWAPKNLYYDSSILELKRNGRFVMKTKQGWYSEKKWYSRKGKWEIKGDTIVLSRLHFITRTGDRRSIVPHRFYERFAITNDQCLLFDDKNNAPRLYCKNNH